MTNGFEISLVPCVVTEVWNGKNIASAVDYHKVSRVFVLDKGQLNIILPAHDKTCAVTGNHVGVARAYENVRGVEKILK